MAIAIRDARVEDEDFILGLNAACLPAVSEMPREDFRAISGWAHRVLVAEHEGKPVGFIILIRPKTAYPSDNYAWFEKQFDRHLYIDRVAVSDDARGLGVGRELYEASAEIAVAAYEQRLTCEVNEEPPNPQSMAFHVKLGFLWLASRPSRSGKVVAMFVRELTP